MTKCLINFEKNEKGIFYSGKTINGTVVIDNDKNRKILSLYLTFEGKAKSQWDKQRGQYTWIKYRGREQFINETVYFVSKDFRVKEVEFAKGHYEYPFSFQIPSHFPTSVEAVDTKFRWEGINGLQGYIRYFLTVNIERQMSSPKKFEFPLTIIRNFDLNFADPRYRTLTNVEGTKNFTLSSKPPLYMSVDAPVTGFVCGEKVKFLVSYRNESSTEVHQTKVQLVRINHFSCTIPKAKTKIGHQEIVSTTFEGVSKKSSKNIETYLVIPSVAPTSDGSCKVLNISYEIHVSAIFGGFSSDYTLKIPVVIGTVPYLPEDLLKDLSIDRFNDEVPSESEHPTTSSSHEPSTPQQYNVRSIFARDQNTWSLGPSTSSVSFQRPSINIPATPEDYDMPPPTYMEAMAGSSVGNTEGNSDDLPESREKTFTPSYPVYKF